MTIVFFYFYFFFKALIATKSMKCFFVEDLYLFLWFIIIFHLCCTFLYLAEKDRPLSLFPLIPITKTWTKKKMLSHYNDIWLEGWNVSFKCCCCFFLSPWTSFEITTTLFLFFIPRWYNLGKLKPTLLFCPLSWGHVRFYDGILVTEGSLVLQLSGQVTCNTPLWLLLG